MDSRWWWCEVIHLLERRHDCITVGGARPSLRSDWDPSHSGNVQASPFRICTRKWRRTRFLGLVLLLTLVGAASCDAADSSLAERAKIIEPQLEGFPQRSADELATLVQAAEVADGETRNFVYALYGQSLVKSNQLAKAKDLADSLQSQGRQRDDGNPLALALLIRGSVEAWNGSAARNYALAEEARTLLSASKDAYLRYWATIAVGTSARQLGRTEDASKSLQEALALADSTRSPYRKSVVLYNLAVLDVMRKQFQTALEESDESFKQASLVESTIGMSRAKNAESAALQFLELPKRELDAMKESLAIAQKGHSETAESLALINLADIYLRRKQFNDVLTLSERSIEIADAKGDQAVAATSRANMAFALIGMGRIKAGQRIADEAAATYERLGATAETGDLLVEYAEHLADAGEYKAALVPIRRERQLRDQIAEKLRNESIIDVQARFESERSRNDAERLRQRTQQQVWWLLAALLAISLAVVVILYRRRVVNLAVMKEKNAELSFQSNHDPLTALYNRRHFQEFIASESTIHDRRDPVESSNQTILLIDIDHFKSINDQFGHVTGDAVLLALAARLREVLRETDMIVRWGGEEFLVFLPATSFDQVDEIVGRVLNAVAQEPIEYMDQRVGLSVSIGYCPVEIPPNRLSPGWERVIALADQALYYAKAAGRNRACGIRQLLRVDESALDAIHTDLAKAEQDGIVELSMLVGDEAANEPRTVSPAPSVSTTQAN